jgi:Holliday junction resolvase RusA-like endonuclease
MSWVQVAAFNVLGDPKPQPRPRAFSRGGQARVYDPGTAEGWKGAIALAARSHLPVEPLQGPVRVSIELRFRRPRAHYVAGKPERGLRPRAPALHTGKPDRDNCEKALLDCLTQLGMWHDDGQVCGGEVSKIYGDAPGARVVIEQEA